MKKKYLILILFLIIGFNNFFLYMYINTTITKEEINDLTFEYNSNILLKDIIGKEKYGSLDTLTLGNRSFEDDEYIINYNVVDTTAPLILGGNKTVTVGSKTDLVNKFLCGDNYDDTPNCYIEGKYDLNKVGTYNLTYVAVDSNNNKSTKNFKLNVIPKSNESSSQKEKQKTPISEFIKKYKTNKTKIGIDVSSWQDDIDWKKVKDSGVEFAILRIGFGHTSKGEIVIDNTYLNNIKKAKEQNIDLGLYFYSYAGSTSEAIEQANWIIKTLDHETLSLPIAFDWEDWSDFNSYKVSFKKLNDIAGAFIDEVEKNGYDGMLYSSAYYLEKIWQDYDNTWLAYYTNNNDYKGKYMMWQLSSSGSVPGIKGPVDINVLYN